MLKHVERKALRKGTVTRKGASACGLEVIGAGSGAAGAMACGATCPRARLCNASVTGEGSAAEIGIAWRLGSKKTKDF